MAEVNTGKQLVQGMGLNDTIGKSQTKAYQKWSRMLERCFCPKLHAKQPTYKQCSVDNDWLIFSNFKKWFDANYIDGLELDKDLLKYNNKHYSPETCVFIPKHINTILNTNTARKGELPLGVTMNQGGYEAKYKVKGKSIFLGYYDDVLEATRAYANAKSRYIKSELKKCALDGTITEQHASAITKTARLTLIAACLDADPYYIAP